MSNKIDFLNLDTYSHAYYAFVTILPFMFFGYVEYIALAVTAFYYGREKRDNENKVGINPKKEPLKNLFPWQWHSKSQMDYYSPMVVSVVMVLIDCIRRGAI